jgi:hypothetical protein
LEENLGFIDFGRFSKHASDGTHASDKVQEFDDWILDPESSEDVLFQEGDDTEVQDNSPTPEPLRKRQKTVTTVLQSTKGPLVTIVPPVTSDQLKIQLWYETERSKDKLFLTARTREGYKKKSWHVVQVSLEDTDMEAARKHRSYHVLCYIRALADSKKFKGRYCNYWPEMGWRKYGSHGSYQTKQSSAAIGNETRQVYVVPRHYRSVFGTDLWTFRFRGRPQDTRGSMECFIGPSRHTSNIH